MFSNDGARITRTFGWSHATGTAHSVVPGSYQGLKDDMQIRRGMLDVDTSAVEKVYFLRVS
jgi:hypothetical protein